MTNLSCSICVVTLIRIWITTLIREDNAEKIYAMIALLTNLEVLFGVINTCLPVIRPIFTKAGDSKVWSLLKSSLGSSGRTIFSRSTSGDRSGIHEITKHTAWQTRNNETKEMHNLSSPPPHIAPRFVDDKAANMMFSHHNQNLSVTTEPPGRPPRSQFYQPDGRWEEKNSSGIMVQRDWDVERADSVETDRRPLTEEKYQKGW